MNVRDASVAAVVFAFSLAAFLLAGTFGGGSGIFPQIISSVMMVASAILFVRAFVRLPTEADVIDEEISSDDRRLTKDEVVRVSIAIVLTTAYIALIVPLGFYTASLLYIPISAYALGQRQHVLIWVATLIYIGAGSYLFTQVFFTPLPRELIFRLF